MRGVSSPLGPSTTFCRSTVMVRLARSNRSTRRSQSGVDSSSSRPMIVERMTGSSEATRHVAKSHPDIRLGLIAVGSVSGTSDTVGYLIKGEGGPVPRT